MTQDVIIGVALAYRQSMRAGWRSSFARTVLQRTGQPVLYDFDERQSLLGEEIGIDQNAVRRHQTRVRLEEEMRGHLWDLPHRLVFRLFLLCDLGALELVLLQACISLACRIVSIFFPYC
jgi:hypothetical protein